MSARAWIAMGALALSTLAPVRADAQTRSRAPECASTASDDESCVRLRRTRRALPDYDGLPEPAPTPEEVLIWIPRILVLPIHLVLEYLIRQPLLWLATTAEREGWVDALEDVFTWDEGRGGIVPTAFFDFGFRPSVGFSLWWNDLYGQGHRFSARFATAGADFLEGKLSGQLELAEPIRLEAMIGGSRRPDLIFAGIGYDSLEENRARFAQDRWRAELALRLQPWRSSYVRASAGVHENRFGNGMFTSDGDVPIEQAIQQGVFPTPPGYPEGYRAYRQRLEVRLDSRSPRPEAPQHGVLLALAGEHSVDLERGAASSWAHYGGASALFADFGGRRVLGWWTFAKFVESLGREPVPFTELVELGGESIPFGGFRTGRLRGDSAVASTLSYRYGVLHWLDGEIFASLGNVFGTHLEDFRPERLRLSFGGGFRTVGTPDGVAFLVGAGSETFEAGAAITSVRFAIGSGIDI